MPSPPVMDLGTGMNTQETIRKLIEYERQPLYRLERENNETSAQIAIWEKLRGYARDLAERSRELSSIAGSFSKRIFTSSDPDSVSGVALAGAKVIKRKIQVEQLASQHELHSDPLELNKKIGKGEFTVRQGKNEKKLNFNGGSPIDFKDFITEELKEFADVSVTDAGENKIVLRLESRKSGKEGELEFKDPKGVLGNAGIITKHRKQIPIEFNSTDLTSGHESPKLQFIVLDEGKKIRFAEGSLRLDLKEFVKSRKEALLHLNIRARKGPAPLEILAPQQTETVVMGPEIEVQVGNVELKGPNLERAREVPVGVNTLKELPIRTEIALLFEVEGKLQKSTYINSLQEGDEKSWTIPLKRIPEGAMIRALAMKTNGESEISSVQFESPQEMRPVHETQPAKDASLKLDGVRILRSRNTELKDIVPGTELTLKKVTNRNVDISIKTDEEQVLKDIREWVKAYNALHTFIRDNSTVANNGLASPRSLEKNNGGGEKSGIFAGSITTLQLRSQCNTIISIAYPTEGKGFRVLPEIGISTGKLGSKWNDIQNGLLEIEDKKLQSALSENPEGLQNLFASNFKTKKKTDNGVAFKMEETIKPYAQMNQGIISVQIDLLKNKIAMNKDSISKRQVIIEKKQETLRSKFGRMEQSVKRNRSTSDYLKRAYSQQGQQGSE